MPSRPLGIFTIAALAAMLLPGIVLGFDVDGGRSAPLVRPASPSGDQPAVERMVAVDPDKKLSAGDKVTLEIVEDREAGLPRVVTATGEIEVPPLGRVRVAGLTATNAAASIKRLLEKDYYHTATVRLSIDQVAAGAVQRGTVLVSGAVQIQGTQILLDGQSRTLADAILRAGPTGWSNLRKVQVTRSHKDGSKEQFRVDVQKINETGNADGTDPVLQDGDRIHVPAKVTRF